MGKGLFYLVTTLICSTASAGERYEFYNGVRSLGMGGATVLVANDETALLHNPAGLGRLRDYFITLFDPEGAVSQETEQIAGLKILDVMDPQDTMELTNKKPGKHLHIRTQLFPSIVVPNFGFGVLGKYEINAETNEDESAFKYHYTNDYALVFGFNLRLFNGIVKLGANARAVNRTEVRRDDIDPASTGNDLKDLAASGVGIASDTAIVLTAPIAWLPSIGAVYRDVGRTSYTYRNGLLMRTDDDPHSTPPTLDVALSVSPILGKRWRSLWTVELKDVMNSAEEDGYVRRAHAGVEFNYADAIFIRGGWHQHWYTAGLELAIVNYQFQAATYGEDIGTPDEPREDRRYVVKFSFRF